MKTPLEIFDSHEKSKIRKGRWVIQCITFPLDNILENWCAPPDFAKLSAIREDGESGAGISLSHDSIIGVTQVGGQQDDRYPTIMWNSGRFQVLKDYPILHYRKKSKPFDKICHSVSGDEKHLRAGTGINAIKSKGPLYGYLSSYIRKLDQKTRPEGFEDVG